MGDLQRFISNFPDSAIGEMVGELTRGFAGDMSVDMSNSERGAWMEDYLRSAHNLAEETDEMEKSVVRLLHGLLEGQALPPYVMQRCNPMHMYVCMHVSMHACTWNVMEAAHVM